MQPTIENRQPRIALILHVDMDAFYASVEQREHPEYRGKPVIVGADPQGGRGRGVVAACSYEARKSGIHSAQPIGRAYRLCPQGIYVRPHGALYHQVSAQIMEILGRFTDLLEQISIDEAFLDVTGAQRLFGDGPEIARKIKETIRKETQLTASIGVATNKFVAKVASDQDKPDGLVVVAPGGEEDFLRELPVRCIWGVGPKTEEKLRRLGVKRIKDVTSRSQEFWNRKMGNYGDHLWALAHGWDDRPVKTERGFKSLSHESTFLKDTGDLREVEATLQGLCEKLARRLRRHQVRGSLVTLKWRDERFVTKTRQKKLSQPSDHSDHFYDVCRQLLREFLPLKRKVRLVGVGVSQFESTLDEEGQTELFAKSQNRVRKLDKSLDQIQKKFGRASIQKASQLAKEETEDRISSFMEH